MLPRLRFSRFLKSMRYFPPPSLRTSSYLSAFPLRYDVPVQVVIPQSRRSDRRNSETIPGSIGIALGFLLFAYAQKRKIGTVHALSKNESNPRQMFNFIADLVDEVADSVVYISLTKSGILSSKTGNCGSGFIISPQGHIITCAHLLQGLPGAEVTVKLRDGRSYIGVFQKIDTRLDLALIKINAEDLPAMKLGPLNNVRAGEWVVAIGSPMTFSHSVSVGVVSSVGRDASEIGMNNGIKYIQTDAAITVGNSGGPLVNLDGEAVGVVGITVLGTNTSFAIPADYVREFLSKEWKRKPKDVSVMTKGYYFGIIVAELTPGVLYNLRRNGARVPENLQNGLLVIGVEPNSPAEKSGLRVWDIISEAGGSVVNSLSSLVDAIESDDKVDIKLIRNGHEQKARIKPKRLS